jgi:UDP-N-acetylmuramoyl-L-alanyl-D-glutamate--2,6-diaminopimelate ligase
MQAADWIAKRAVSGAHLSSDSRTVAPGDVFFAYPGNAHDGRDYIADAIAQGAAMVIAEAQNFDASSITAVPLLSVSRLKQTAGEIASAYYGHPTQHLQIIGITGTSGKTTTAQWTAHCLSALGKKCAVIGTLGSGFIGAQKQTGFTTPQAVELQRLLADLRLQGAQAAVIEVSSIGLAEHRLNGTCFDTAVFTNLSHDHLDYHGSMKHYEAAKRALFEWPQLRTAVVNREDAAGARLATLVAARIPPLQLITYTTQGLATRMGTAANTELFVKQWAWTTSGAQVQISDGEFVQTLDLPAFGVFNVANALAVIGVLKGQGFSLSQAAQVLATVPAVNGRLNALGGDGCPLVIIDYAHKPDALEKVLLAMRPVAQQRNGKLICIFGCGGNRDPSKRAVMAAIACQQADEVIVTSDNPRSEDPLSIITQILTGVPADFPVTTQADRALAIASAISQATANDVVIVAGKGHETYQETLGVKHPFVDAEHAASALGRWQQVPA